MFKNIENQKVPSVTFRARENGAWKDITTSELFDNKTVIVFSLPGAFTPTCSSTHLPGYDRLAKQFKALGVDSILCVSVNDGFVMEAWCKDQKCGNVQLIPDGNGEFTEKMGMLCDKANLGFGKRSWRYSMLVKNGVIEKMFIEPEVEGDPFEVSDAENMLKYLDPNAEPQKEITVISKIGCPFCHKAKQMLGAAGLEYSEVVLDRDVPSAALRGLSGAKTVPQVFVDGKLIGGSEALESYLAQAAKA